jgi:eukaryotic-like serine/threonine-protein kinase
MRRRAVDRLLVEYLELPDVDQPDFLKRCRQHYPRLSRWLDEMTDGGHTVTLLDESVRKLADQAVQFSPLTVKALEPDTPLGPWVVRAAVGQGGMGMVYRGERADGAFEMEVAIKLIGQRRRGLAELLQRESRLLARLDHPSVTRLVDAGLDEQAGPFLVMEWVEGTDLAQWLKDNEPPLAQRLDLFCQLAEATAHAHQRLIVHGDIKPNNIRIREDSSVKLMDFGVARLMETGETKDDELRALTPDFAAPEQLAGEAVTPASDIWSLGTLLRWLLTGQVHASDEQAREHLAQMSGRLRARELHAIIEKACAEEPEQRYTSVEALTADLGRLRANQPVMALPATASYRAGRFTRRNWAGLGLSMLFIAAVSMGAGGMLWQSQQKQAEAQRALVQAERAEAVKDFLVDMLSLADPSLSPGEPTTVRDMLEQSSPQVMDRFSDQPDIALELLTVIGWAYHHQHRPEDSNEVFERGLALLESEAENIDPGNAAAFLNGYAAATDDLALMADLRNRALEWLSAVPEDILSRSVTLSGLAYVHFSTGEPEKAVDTSRQASSLACRPEALAEDPAYCADILSDQYYFHNFLGEREAAYEAAARSYEIRTGIETEMSGQEMVKTISSYAMYADALISIGRAQEAIGIMREYEREVLEVMGDDALYLAAGGYRVASALSNLGRNLEAADQWRSALGQMQAELPSNLAIPVQLNWLVDSLLHLHLVDEAAEAYATFVHPYDEESMPSHAAAFFRHNQDLMRLFGSPPRHATRREWEQVADGSESGEGSPLKWLAFHALRAALDRDDLEAAEQWKSQLSSNPLVSVTARDQHTLRAQYWLRIGNLEQAQLLIDEVLQAFEKYNETQGPRWARFLAVKAGLYCQTGKIESGRRLRYQSVEEWLEAGGHPDIADRLLAISESCEPLQGGLSTGQ